MGWIQVTDDFGFTAALQASSISGLRSDPDGSGCIIKQVDGEHKVAESLGTLLNALQQDSLAAVGRGLSLSQVTKTGAYTATLADHTILCDATGGAFTVSLPPAALTTGQVYVIKKIDSSGNAITIDGNGSETIDGSTTKSVGSQYQTMMIQSNGSNWLILAAGAAA